VSIPPGGRVLIADDDRGVRESVAEILSSYGYSVVEADDGDVALERLAAGDVDAVLLDVKMPRRDGLSVLDDMTPPPPPPGVILVTAYDITPDERRRLGGRVTRILRKPVPPRTLLDVIGEAIRASRPSAG
jgi:CheY-like chemotaxis protein